MSVSIYWKHEVEKAIYAKQEKAWQRRVEKQVKAENVELGHSQSKERFENVIQLL